MKNVKNILLLSGCLMVFGNIAFAMIPAPDGSSTADNTQTSEVSSMPDVLYKIMHMIGWGKSDSDGIPTYLIEKENKVLYFLTKDNAIDALIPALEKYEDSGHDIKFEVKVLKFLVTELQKYGEISFDGGRYVLRVPGKESVPMVPRSACTVVISADFLAK